jgi:hypothetical protein
LAWKAVGVHDSFRLTCITGQTSRQNLWPDEKQLYEALRHSWTNSRVLGSVARISTSSATRSANGASSTSGTVPGVNGRSSASPPGGPPTCVCVIWAPFAEVSPWA